MGTKITGLTADTSPTVDDLIVTVNNPSGTPANRKVTIGDLLTFLFNSNAYGVSSSISYGPIYKFTPPVDGSFTWVNQGTATTDSTKGGIYIEDATAGSINIRARVMNAPATPYTITTAWLVALIANYGGLCIGWRDSTSGSIVIWLARYNGATWQLLSDKYTSATVYTASYGSTGLTALGSVIWLRIRDNGTMRFCDYSGDGQHWLNFHNVARTDFITPDQVLFGLNINTGVCGATLLSWAQT